MTTYIKPDWREQRRMQALKLKDKGWKNVRIAEALGVSQGAVSQWFKRLAEGGKAALRQQLPRGATPKLGAEQLKEWLRFISDNASESPALQARLLLN